MKILILGIDGYIGWPLALHLLEQGYEVAGVDNHSRRQRVKEVGSDSLTPIGDLVLRRQILNRYENYLGERFSSGIHDHFSYIEFCDVPRSLWVFGPFL